MHWLIIFLEIALNRSLSYETNSFLPLPFQVFEIKHPLGRSHQRFIQNSRSKISELYLYNTKSKNLVCNFDSIFRFQRGLINLKKISTDRLRNLHLDFGESRWRNRQVPKSGANSGIHGGPRCLLGHVLILSYVT